MSQEAVAGYFIYQYCGLRIHSQAINKRLLTLSQKQANIFEILVNTLFKYVTSAVTP